MLIQKTFHLQMDRDSAKERLSNMSEYHRFFIGVDEALFHSAGAARFRFRLPCGFRAEVELAEIPGKNPAQTLFRSRSGNLTVAGVLEYFQIKPALTEVVLTVDYTIGSPLFNALDYLFNTMDRFLNRQLQSVEAHLNQHLTGFRADTRLRQPINGHPLHEEPM